MAEQSENVFFLSLSSFTKKWVSCAMIITRRFMFQYTAQPHIFCPLTMWKYVLYEVLNANNRSFW